MSGGGDGGGGNGKTLPTTIPAPRNRSTYTRAARCTVSCDGVIGNPFCGGGLLRVSRVRIAVPTPLRLSAVVDRSIDFRKTNVGMVYT